MLNKEQIEAIIPQRDPFLMIDEVEEYNPGEYCIGYKNLIFLTLFAQNLLSPQLLYQSFLPLILLHPHLHLKI